MALAEPIIAARITYEQFEAFLAQQAQADRRFELIDGEIQEKNVTTQEHGMTAVELIYFLRRFLEENPIGRLMTEVLYRDPADPDNARQPDISFTANVDEPVVKKGAVARMPDLAVEIKSPHDTYRGLREKGYYYLAHGTKLVWLVYPEKRQIEVLRADGDFDLLRADDMLSGEDVLPGVALAVAAVFGTV